MRIKSLTDILGYTSRHLINKDSLPKLGGVLCAAVVHLLSKQHSKTIIIAPEESASAIIHNLRVFGERALVFLPEPGILPYEDKPVESQRAAARVAAIWQFVNGDANIMVTTPTASAFPTIKGDALSSLAIKIAVGDRLNITKLSHQLLSMGYTRVDVVEMIGSFSVRGDIVDIFSPAYPDPVRIELDWDTISSVRLFAAESQRSFEDRDRALILPPTEWLRNTRLSYRKFRAFLPDGYSERRIEELYSAFVSDPEFPGAIWLAPFLTPKVPRIWDTISNDDLVISVEPEAVEGEITSLIDTAERLYKEISAVYPYPAPDRLFTTYENLSQALEQFNCVKIGDAMDSIVYPPEEGYHDDFISPTIGDDGIVLCATQSPAGVEKFDSLARSDNRVKRLPVELWGGFFDPNEHFLLLTDRELVSRPVPRARYAIYRESIAYLASAHLKVNDLVVHSDHGIARFRGIETLTLGGRPTECLRLEYANGQMLFVPIEDFHLVQKYIGSEQTSLSKLGGSGWSKSKARALKSAEALAGELLHLYAVRKSVQTTSFGEAPDFEEPVDANFPYQLTQDQIRALKEIQKDLAEPHPMDRLLCGDVGFGKTEVALRASMRVVAAGKQVAVLVPTTVLCEQHYRTFSDRLGALPIKIEMLSRFRSSAEQKEILKRLADGDVDIIIGTHRMLSKDVVFKALGLLIVDEEQRFGVAHKERIKSWHAKVDVLTMTATPIPRTLYMSISGLRDISIIGTPPREREPIFTRLIPFDKELIREAIEHEIERGGQVFFLHNRVRTIDAMREMLSELVPHLRIAVSHGQMPGNKLERVVMDFISRKYDILLTTTIIEAGTDIPNVNTIIINRSDRFGLSQLYQLRGRVGRSNRQAFAYLIVPERREMTNDAFARLRAILSHTALGSGFSLAMRDMEIRGAGEILGRKQSGAVEKVGLNLYAQLIAQAVARLKGTVEPIFIPPPMEMDFSMGLPKDYIESADLRIGFYQRLFTAASLDELGRAFAELQDRFGALPDDAALLREYLICRLKAYRVGVSRVVFRDGVGTVIFSGGKTLFELAKSLSGFEGIVGFGAEPIPVIRLARPDDHREELMQFRRFLDVLIAAEK